MEKTTMIKLSSKIKMMLATALMVMGVVGAAVPAMAADCNSCRCTSGTPVLSAECGAICAGDCTKPPVSLMESIQRIITLLIYAIGSVSVVVIILGGFRYTMSQGDASQVKQAKDTIMYGVIGLVVAILAFAIVQFVLDGVFKSS
jgi:hypothetical protein